MIAAALWITPRIDAQERSDNWPLVFTSGQDQVQVFKPQPESFDGTSFTARAAVALQRPQDSSPLFGAIWGNGLLAVDRSTRMGTLSSFKVTDARFPGITDEAERSRVIAMLSEGIARNAPPVDIDWLVAALEQEKQADNGYNNTPPEIIYSEKPGILLYIDGNPVLSPVKAAEINNDPVYAASAPNVERVVNTPFFLVRVDGKAYWLYGSGLWYSAPAATGPWTNESKAPAYLQQLAAKVDSSYTAERPQGLVPEVVVSTKPAVLLDLNGPPQLEPYSNSSLMYVTNTDNDLFLDIPTQEYYLLASGRWYATKDLRNGPWRYVAPDALPAGFAQVPEGSPKDGILAHVADTDQAREAVRDASIPQTAQVDRRTATVTVTYDGAPEFRRIAGTDVFAAANASTTVLRIHGRYYVVDNAVWFEGDTPDGPWTVSTRVPGEVNDIPPSDPNYRVRYVYIYDHTPDVVFIGYTPGYLGSYVQGGTVIYGTGFYYEPWHSHYWYPRPYTWGFGFTYNPWYGWGFGARWGFNWFYPGWTYYGYYRPYSWGWWGPYAYCPPIATWYGHDHYWHGHYVTGHYGGYYGHRPGMAQRTGTTGRLTDVSPARTTDLYTNHRTRGVTPTTIAARPATRGAAGTAPTAARDNATRGGRVIAGDHFTDRQGNVYRIEQGRTEELRDGQWRPVTQPGNRTPQAGDTRGTDRSNAAPGRTAPGTQPTSPAVREPSRPAQPDPREIQRERMRGEQRVDDYRGYQNDRQPSTAPAPRAPRTVAPSAPTRSAPSTRPAPSSPGRSTTPSHGGSGGSSGSRRPR